MLSVLQPRKRQRRASAADARSARTSGLRFKRELPQRRQDPRAIVQIVIPKWAGNRKAEQPGPSQDPD